MRSIFRIISVLWHNCLSVGIWVLFMILIVVTVIAVVLQLTGVVDVRGILETLSREAGF
jgi:hypothetical protein